MTARAPSASRAGLAVPRVSRGTLSLVVLAAIGLCAGIILTRSDVAHPLVALSGALLALGVPGVACTRALFPGAGIGRAERTALIVGIQLSLVVVCGFLLHLLRPGLSAPSWGALLADVTLVACLVAWIRGRGLQAAGTGAASAGTGAASAGTGAASAGTGAAALGVPGVRAPGWSAALAGATGAQLGMLALAGLLALAALGIARAGESAQPLPTWTALAIVSADDGRAVGIDITNSEARDESYRATISIDGTPLTSVDAVPVASGGSAHLEVPLPAAGALLRQVSVDLWRAEDPVGDPPYRSVTLSLRGSAGGSAAQ